MPGLEAPEFKFRAIDSVLQTLENSIISGDLKKLDGLFCEGTSAVLSGSPGLVRGRDAFLEVWKRLLDSWSEVTIHRRDMMIQICGDVAWTSFLWDGEGKLDGQRYRLEGERLTVVLLLENSRWCLTHIHMSMPYKDWGSHRLCDLDRC